MADQREELAKQRAFKGFRETYERPFDRNNPRDVKFIDNRIKDHLKIMEDHEKMRKKPNGR